MVLRDKLLLAAWVFSYAAILWVFELLKVFEARKKHSRG